MFLISKNKMAENLMVSGEKKDVPKFLGHSLISLGEDKTTIEKVLASILEKFPQATLRFGVDQDLKSLKTRAFEFLKREVQDKKNYGESVSPEEFQISLRFFDSPKGKEIFLGFANDYFKQKKETNDKVGKVLDAEAFLENPDLVRPIE